MITTRIVQVLLVTGTLALVAYAVRTAWLDWVRTPVDVLHKFDGKPRIEGAWYSAEFDNRLDARRYALELSRCAGVTHVHMRKHYCN